MGAIRAHQYGSSVRYHQHGLAIIKEIQCRFAPRHGSDSATGSARVLDAKSDSGITQ